MEHFWGNITSPIFRFRPILGHFSQISTTKVFIFQNWRLKLKIGFKNKKKLSNSRSYSFRNQWVNNLFFTFISCQTLIGTWIWLNFYEKYVPVCPTSTMNFVRFGLKFFSDSCNNKIFLNINWVVFNEARVYIKSMFFSSRKFSNIQFLFL